MSVSITLSVKVNRAREMIQESWSNISIREAEKSSSESQLVIGNMMGIQFRNTRLDTQVSNIPHKLTSQ